MSDSEKELYDETKNEIKPKTLNESEDEKNNKEQEEDNSDSSAEKKLKMIENDSSQSNENYEEDKSNQKKFNKEMKNNIHKNESENYEQSEEENNSEYIISDKNNKNKIYKKSGRFLEKKRKREDKKKKEKKHKKKRNYGGEFLDMDAIESSGEEDSEVGEITSKQQKELFDQYYTKVKIPQKKVSEMKEEDLKKHFENLAENNYDEGNDEFQNNVNQPNSDDPKLWLVKTKLGKERESVLTLFNKFFSYNKSDKNKLKIFSALSFDSLKGYIYIEAFKEANVKEAISGISSIKENSIKIVPMNEMTQVFRYDKLKTADIKKGQYVRIKNGLYEKDLAQVIHIEDIINKIYVKLIPRIQAQNEEMKVENIGDYNKKLKKNIKAKPKLFNRKKFKDYETRQNSFGNIYIWNKQMFQGGFLIKPMKARSLITENVRPTLEELKYFNIKVDEESNDENEKNESNSCQNLNELYQKKKFFKGDKVKINQGDLNGIIGTVISHENKCVQMYTNVKGIEKEILNIPEEIVSKQFIPGEFVTVISGENIGKRGCIVQIKDDDVIIFSEETLTNFIVNSSDIAISNQKELQGESHSFFKIGELVRISNSEEVCYIIKTNPYILNVLTARNELKEINARDATKIGENKINGIDAKGFPMAKNDTARVINGRNAKVKGQVKNIYKGIVFLHNNEFVETNGIFAENCRNVEILGSDLLMNSGGTIGRVNKRIVPEELRKLVGQTIDIIQGSYKGLKGRVTDITDKQASIELSSKPKIVRVDINFIKQAGKSGDDGIYDNTNYYNGYSTPGHAPKTPAYYPPLSPNPFQQGILII